MTRRTPGVATARGHPSMDLWRQLIANKDVVESERFVPASSTGGSPTAWSRGGSVKEVLALTCGTGYDISVCLWKHPDAWNGSGCRGIYMI
jgi:hypothetical protein